MPTDEGKRRTAVRLTREMWLKLGRLALERDQSVNDLFLLGMTDWFNRQPEAKEYGKLPLLEPTKKGRPFKDEEEAAEEEPPKASKRGSKSKA